MKAFFLVCLLMLPVKAWSCTCDGTASIEDVIADSPLLVEAEVVGLEEVDDSKYGRLVSSVTLQVRRVLKGTVTTEDIVIESSMCYSSLYPEIMEKGHVYILPLGEGFKGHYSLAACAHSGLELVDGKLFTFEHAKGLKRRLQFYKKYSRFISDLSVTRKEDAVEGSDGSASPTQAFVHRVTQSNPRCLANRNASIRLLTPSFPIASDK